MPPRSSSSYHEFLANLTGSQHFDIKYKCAREFESARKNGDTKRLKELDFATTAVCFYCSQLCKDPITNEWKPMLCGGCGGIVYCSRECQVKSWKAHKIPGIPSHKELCPNNKEYMKRLPYFRGELTQFPWGRIESDGTCDHDVIRALFQVLGSGPSFGYWSIPGGVRPHDDTPDMNVPKDERGRPSDAKYTHGEVLLGDAWPTDVDAWKLSDVEHIPRLFFDGDIPARPEPGQITDWKSWYAWRGLSLESPAALLMDYPLSVYHLLVDVLKLVPSGGASEKKRLNIHYIGAEVELNFLPLFSELALLLPNTHIDLTMFGKPVHSLVQTARKKHPGSLATQDIVWSYAAPRRTGGGSIDIRLYSTGENWTKSTILDEVHDEAGIPNALLGLNAGLLSYHTWGEPLRFSRLLDIPFAVTDYCEETMATTATALPKVFGQIDTQFQAVSGGQVVDLIKKREYPVRANPFHRPGQRCLGVTRMPNSYNGFSMPVVMKGVNAKT